MISSSFYLYFKDGPFLLLLVASLGSVVIAVLEIIYYTYKMTKKYRNEASGSPGNHYYDIHQRYYYIYMSNSNQKSIQYISSTTNQFYHFVDLLGPSLKMKYEPRLVVLQQYLQDQSIFILRCLLTLPLECAAIVDLAQGVVHLDQ